MMKTTALIIGAGPAGLCCAQALALQGIEVDIFDRQSSEQLANAAFDGREVALTHASIHALKALQIWARIPADVPRPFRRAQIQDGHQQPFYIDSQAQQADWLGQFVSNHEIRRAAWQLVDANPLIRVHTDTEVTSFNTDAGAASLQLADGTHYTAQLLIAADSRFSQTRRQMGIATRMQDIGASMLLCRIRHERQNDGTALEWFGNGLTRALLPLNDQVSSAILTLPHAQALRLQQLSGSDFSDKLNAAFDCQLGAVEPLTERFLYPLVTTWAERFIDQRFALVGDAAVGMHPVTAHGFNLGLASATTLAAVLATGCRRHHDAGHSQALRQYQRRHRLKSAPLYRGTQALSELFTNEHLLARPLRRLVMQTGRRFPAIPARIAASVVRPSYLPLANKLPGF